MAKTVTQTYTWDKIDAVIATVQKDGQTLRQKIHNVAVSIMKHWHDNADDAQAVAEKFTALSVAAGYHANALGKWVQTYSPMKYSAENKAYYVHVDDARLMGKALMTLRDTPFWTVSPPAAPKALNILEEIQRLIDKAQKHVAKPVEGDVIDPAIIRKLRDIKEATAA